ncbi:MAG TPA: hypothetical protein ENI85_15375 [Deltaproteobacteria bacterium]|nr:hypothetical protein [Deltaproteobacteria bacterium]
MKRKMSPGKHLDGALQALLEATEALHEGVTGGIGESDLDGLFERRKRAFEDLRRRVGEGGEPGPGGRARLVRIRSLDREILELGAALVSQVRGQRQALQRRRSAVQAHTTRDRSEPRLVTMKA